MSEKPRILCLHGGGASAEIFEIQMRYFINSLAHDFQFVFANGPWLSEMHEDLKPVYSDMGPCYRWANWSPFHPPFNDTSAIAEVESCLMKAMNNDEGKGEWVGLLGFSQGAALAFSILLENQLRLQQDPWARAFTGVNWRFGVIMAGRAPPYSLNSITQKSQHYSSLTQASQGWEKALSSAPFPNRLRTPTLHVHGLQDAAIEFHQDLLKYFTSPPHTKLVEWDGAHRIPFRNADAQETTEAMLEIANAQDMLAKNVPAAEESLFDWLLQGNAVYG